MPTIALILPALLVLIVCALCCVMRANTLIVLHELQHDRTNPHDGVRTLNEYADAEMYAHIARMLLFAFAGDTLGVLLTLPLLAWHSTLRQNGTFLADVTEILKPDELSARRRRAMIELAVYGASFLYSVCGLVELLFARWLADPIIVHGLKHIFPSAKDMN